MKRAFYLLLLLAIVLAWRDWSRREIVHPPGVLVHEAPRQRPVEGSQVIKLEDYRLTPRALFELRARVLSREALGWRGMSDQAVLDRIEVSQGARWYRTRYDYPAPMADRDIIRQSGNMHMVPANAAIRARLKQIRRGDLVWLRGYLVDADHDSGFRWRTSLSREDTGDGACEVFYIERITIEPRN